MKATMTNTQGECKEYDIPDAVHPCIPTTRTVPYCCPVCEGRGNVPCNFYTRALVVADASPIECKACEGFGIINRYA